LEHLIDIFTVQRPLLDPAVRAVRGSDVDEAAVCGALENVKALAVFDRGNLVIDGSDTVAEEGLWRGDVGGFVGSASMTLARSCAEYEREGRDGAELEEGARHGVFRCLRVNDTCPGATP
jgi:hypothetical protein